MRTLGLFALFLLTADPGPAVGSKVPPFELTDQNGRTRTLPDVMGPKGVMLVFFRSADW
jgi:peroxiredoxin